MRKWFCIWKQIEQMVISTTDIVFALKNRSITYWIRMLNKWSLRMRNWFSIKNNSNKWSLVLNDIVFALKNRSSKYWNIVLPIERSIVMFDAGPAFIPCMLVWKHIQTQFVWDDEQSPQHYHRQEYNVSFVYWKSDGNNVLMRIQKQKKCKSG